MKQICPDCSGMGRFDDYPCETCKGTGFITRSPERQDQLEALRPLDGSFTVGIDPNANAAYDLPPTSYLGIFRRVSRGAK